MRIKQFHFSATQRTSSPLLSCELHLVGASGGVVVFCLPQYYYSLIFQVFKINQYDYARSLLKNNSK